VLTQIIVWLNAAANLVATVLLAPLGVLPGWASATLVAAVTGLLMLWAFKYTSRQTAIKRTRNQIKANLLALSLFQDHVSVSLRAQGRILGAALRLLWLAIVPMLVMLVPMCLLLGQLALWYQARPLHVGEEAVIAVQLAEDGPGAPPEVQLLANPAVDTVTGPVRVPAKQLVCWNLRARTPGYHRLMFDVAGQTFDKELAIGQGFMRTSLQRPGWSWSAALLHPRETPLARTAPVQSITIDYPERQSWMAGSRSWLWYWFGASLIVAFVARPLLKVDI